MRAKDGYTHQSERDIQLYPVNSVRDVRLSDAVELHSHAYWMRPRSIAMALINCCAEGQDAAGILPRI